MEDGSKASTCKPALGYSFAAGTTDGPGNVTYGWANTVIETATVLRSTIILL